MRVSLRLSTHVIFTLSPLAPPPDRRVEIGFAEPISAPESIHRATEVLVQRLSRMLGEHQLGVRALRLTAYRLDGTVSGIAIGTARPAGSISGTAARAAARCARTPASNMPDQCASGCSQKGAAKRGQSMRS